MCVAFSCCLLLADLMNDVSLCIDRYQHQRYKSTYLVFLYITIRSVFALCKCSWQVQMFTK